MEAAVAVNLSMAGKVRTKEKCPRCDGAFSGSRLTCPSCLTTPRRFYIDLYVKAAGQIRIYSDRQGRSLTSYDHAERVLTGIRYEIDQKVFDYTKYVKEDVRSYLFENRAEAWLEAKAEEARKDNLAESYIKALKRYKNTYFLPFFKGMDVREVKTFHIHEFYRKLPKKSPKYTKNILNALENLFNTLVRLEYLDRKPSFPSVTLDRKTPKWIPFQTQTKALEAIVPEDRPIFTFLALQGTRPGEARALKIKDVDFSLGTLTIRRTFADRKLKDRVKSKVVRPRLMNPSLAAMLAELCKDKTPEAFVFTNPRTGKPYSEDAIFRIWNAARNAIGLDITLYEATRHSVASIAASNGAPLLGIKEVLGHTDIRTTLIYAHADLQLQKVVFGAKSEVVEFSSRVAPEGKCGEKVEPNQ